MSNRFYAVSPLRLRGSSALIEASKEELRVLLLLIESGGVIDSTDELAGAAEISVARCNSAIAFWEESNIIVKRTEAGNAIIHEFEDKLLPDEIEEVEAVKVAKSIRDEELSSMLDECAGFLGIACLSQANIKSLTGLHTQYGLSPAYIALLAADMAANASEGCKLTVRRLCNEAIRLSSKGCDTLEALEMYIEKKNATQGYEWEFRRVMGIYGNISDAQRDHFRTWHDEYGFSADIVGEAYDVALNNTAQGSKFPYMSKVLKSWHEGGCKTVSECRAYSEANKPKRGTRTASKTAAPTPRYGNFDVNDAFAKALARSYGEQEKEEK